METINLYLENMFANLPKSDEVMRAKTELRSMMEDKYRELKAAGKAEHEAVGIVISEFGNLEELMEELGIAGNENAMGKEEMPSGVEVTLEQAENYYEANKKAAKRIGIGVALCITSPVLLVLMDALITFRSMDAKIGEVIGLLALFMMIGCAVSLFIVNGMALDKFEYMKKERIIVQQSVREIFRQRKEVRSQRFAAKIAVGVVLCVMSAVPAIVLGTLFPDSFAEEISVVFLFGFVAMGVYLFITAGMENESYSVILQEGDYRPHKKEANKLIEPIGGIYWPIITILYLGYSFLTANWHISWIIWPIAGIVFGIIAIICNLIETNSKK